MSKAAEPAAGARYHVVSAALHWISAAAVLTLFPLGMAMNVASGPVQLALYRAHMVVGWLVVLLTLIRVVWRFVEPPPPPPPMPAPRVVAFHTVHFLSLAVLLALAVSGAASLYASGMGVTPRTVTGGVDESTAAHRAHWVLAAILGSLLVAHVIGALSHRPRGSALARMRVGKAAHGGAEGL